MLYQFRYQPTIAGQRVIDVPATAIVEAKDGGWAIHALMLSGVALPPLTPLHEAVSDYLLDTLGASIDRALSELAG